jgi:hypothetical protein
MIYTESLEKFVSAKHFLFTVGLNEKMYIVISF